MEDRSNPKEPVLDDQNDANLGAVTDDAENREVFLFDVIQLKGVPRKLDLGYKPLCQV